MQVDETWPEQVTYDQFLLFGDSLTEKSLGPNGGPNFGARLSYDYIRRLDVVNRGFGGYNTAQALHILPKIIPNPKIAKVKLMTIFFGANDAALPDYHTFQHISVEDYSRNLEAMLYEGEVDGKVTCGRRAATTRKYADACKAVGLKHNVAVLDIWSTIMGLAGWDGSEDLPGLLTQEQSQVFKNLLSDGLHFSADGYQILYDELLQLIREKFPDCAPENLDEVFPRWMSALPQDPRRAAQADYH